MPNLTNLLDKEAGVQYAGQANDQSAAQRMSGGIKPSLIMGVFRRGVFNELMLITKQNVKAVLGEDLSNPDYVAVVDALEYVPAVQVLRLQSAFQVEIITMN